MIDRIEGDILSIEPTHAVVSVGGVGFFLHITLNTYEAVGRAKRFCFMTYLHVREDALILFGFSTKAEREAFLRLISVSGVGPKVGQAILSSLSVRTLQDAVRAGDWKRLTAAPGVGRKLAERMVIELRNVFGKADDSALEGSEAGDSGYSGGSGAIYDAVQGMIALGFNPAQAEKAVGKAAKKVGEDGNVEDLIRLALKS